MTVLISGTLRASRRDVNGGGPVCMLRGVTPCQISLQGLEIDLFQVLIEAGSESLKVGLSPWG